MLRRHYCRSISASVIGSYYTFFWRARRTADVTVRFEYRQEKLHAFTQAREVRYENARGRYQTRLRDYRRRLFQRRAGYRLARIAHRGRPNRGHEPILSLGIRHAGSPSLRVFLQLMAIGGLGGRRTNRATSRRSPRRFDSVSAKFYPLISRGVLDSSRRQRTGGLGARGRAGQLPQ